MRGGVTLLVLASIVLRVEGHELELKSGSTKERQIIPKLLDTKRTYENSIAPSVNIHATEADEIHLPDTQDIQRLLSPQGPNPQHMLQPAEFAESLDVSTLRQACNTVVGAIELQEANVERPRIPGSTIKGAIKGASGWFCILFLFCTFSCIESNCGSVNFCERAYPIEGCFSCMLS